MSTDQCPEEIQSQLLSLGYSNEVIGDLETYVRELNHWCKSINLIGHSTLPQIWHRHILDCAQLAKLIPEVSTSIMDVGTGAGLPGMILAVLRSHELHLVEPNIKKVTFLRHIAAILDLDICIHPKPIEDIALSPVDVIVSRALMEPELLIRKSRNVRATTSTLLSCLGKQSQLSHKIIIDDEMFHVKHVQSITEPSSSIACIQSAPNV